MSYTNDQEQTQKACVFSWDPHSFLVTIPRQKKFSRKYMKIPQKIKILHYGYCSNGT